LRVYHYLCCSHLHYNFHWFGFHYLSYL
jgi:hypothetical protein